MSERTRVQHLTEGLVGPHRRLYATSVTFHQAVDWLVAMLPVMVEGLVVDAQRREVDRLALMRQMMAAPTTYYPTVPAEWRRSLPASEPGTNIPREPRRDW